jgi:hypothetical protein
MSVDVEIGREALGSNEALSRPAYEGVRPVGAIDPERLSQILEDSTSVIVDGYAPEPVLVSVDHAVGFDPGRCRDLVLDDRRDTVLYHVTPPAGLEHSAIRDTMTAAFDGLPYGYVFFDTTELEEIPPALAEALEASGHAYGEFPLLDDEAAVGNQEASISLYGIDFPVEHPESAVDNPTLRSVYDQYAVSVAEGRYAYDTQDGTALMMGDQLDDELLDQLWDMFEDRFQWLGEKHPVLMEDERANFDMVMRDPNTLTAICYEEGEPVCFTFFSEGPESLFWLNQDFVHDQEKMNMDPTQTLLYVPGIVSSGKSGDGHSWKVLSQISNALADTNGKFRIIFENTNRSEEYIPRIVQVTINMQGRGLTGNPEVLDKTYYRCLWFGERTDPELVSSS